MSKHRIVVLTDEERQQLEQLVRTGSSKARMLTRARILLLSDAGEAGLAHKHSAQQISAALGCNMGTVQKVRHRFLDEGLSSALTEKPRPGASLRRKITGDVEAKITTLACSQPPEGHAQWSLRLLADRIIDLGYVESISHVAVGDALKKTRSNPGA